jgi:hypothetical protein
MPTRVRCCASNLEAKIVLDIVLSGQDAELELPGMIVRLRAADTDEGLNAAFDEDDGALSVQDLVRTHRSIASCLCSGHRHHITSLLGWRLCMQEAFQQDLGDIIVGNLVSIVLCLFATCAVCCPPSPSSTVHARVRAHCAPPLSALIRVHDPPVRHVTLDASGRLLCSKRNLSASAERRSTL